MWLEMEDPFELLANAIGPPWEDELESSCRLRAATWQPVTGSDVWEHSVLHCARSPQEGGLFPCFCVHRFVLRDGTAAPLNAALLALARRELVGTKSESASNIGGHHSSRDLCDWPAVQAMGLPALLADALRLAAEVTAAELLAAAAVELADGTVETVDLLQTDATATARAEAGAGAAPDKSRRADATRNSHESAAAEDAAAAKAENVAEVGEAHDTMTPQEHRRAQYRARCARREEGAAWLPTPLLGEAAAWLPHEAWLNCLTSGDWNVLHTHPGCSFSGCYYAADGADGGGADGGVGASDGAGGAGGDGDGDGDGDGTRLYPAALLAGRLALCPTGPPRLSAEQTSTHIALRSRCPTGCATPSGELRGSSEGGFEYLLLEPRPGTCLVWPSFVPHFVLPVPPTPQVQPPASSDAADGSRSERHRVSVAFNR